jgi:hypothetical protein
MVFYKSRQTKKQKIKSKKIKSKKSRKYKTKKKVYIQSGGKGDNNNDNGNITGLFSEFVKVGSSALNTVSASLPEEISVSSSSNENHNSSNTKKEQNKTQNKEQNKEQATPSIKLTIKELLQEADSHNPGDFSLYLGNNPFIESKINSSK